MVEKPIRMGRKQTWRLLLVLLLGQLASLFAAISSFSTSYMANLGVHTPLTQCLLIYLSLAVVYGSILLHRRQKLVVPWYWYIILAIADVQGGSLVLKAYQYSPLTSVVLLYSCIVPWAMILTWFILRTRYSLWQLCGAIICVVGFMLVLFSRASSRGGSNPLLGNTLVVAGTLCVALSGVGEVALFAGYTAASFLCYTLAPLVLKMSGATLFYLSLLTTNIWAVLIRIFFYREKVDWLYFVAFAIVAVGLIVYSLNETASGTATTIVDDEAAIQYEPLPEEISS